MQDLLSYKENLQKEAKGLRQNKSSFIGQGQNYKTQGFAEATSPHTRRLEQDKARLLHV